MKRSLMVNLVSLGVLAVVTQPSTEVAAAIIIDTFETTQSITAEGPAGTANGSIMGAGILGTEQDMAIEVNSGTGWLTLAADEFDVFGEDLDLLSHSHDASITGQSWITWDGVADTPTGLGGVDLTEGGLSSVFEFDVIMDDFAVDLTFTVWTDAANWSVGTIALPGGIPFNPGQTFVLPYADFTVGGGTGADFENVGAIELLIDGQIPGTDLLLGIIQTPEPGTASLIMLGALALLRRRR